MTIVQINAVYGTGSTGRITREMHNFLVQKGHESFVFCSDKSYPEENIFCMGNCFSRKVHGALSRATGLQGCFSAPAMTKLLNLSRKWRRIPHY